MRELQPSSPGITHVIVAWAAPAGPACAQALPGLALPRLQTLLSLLQAQPTDNGSAESRCTPAERTVARLQGLWSEDGRVPWAAHALQQEGSDPGGAAWAWITPCHWMVATHDIAMGDPQSLQLDEAESRALMAAMSPYFAEDGIVLRWQSPLQWLACGEPLRDLACTSLDRVIGGSLQSRLREAYPNAALRRLQNEMQMLLYQQPVNEARMARGLPPVNSFWISGAGALAPLAPGLLQHQRPEQIQLLTDLRAAALVDDAQAWSAAWAALDASHIDGCLQRARRGEALSLTLCGTQHAVTWTTPVAQAWWSRLHRALRRRLRPPTPQLTLQPL